MESLSTLLLHDNQLTGFLPRGLGGGRLRDVVFENNQLQVGVCSTFSCLVVYSWKSLWLWQCASMLSVPDHLHGTQGPIPDEWCSLLLRTDSRLNTIRPHGNRLVCGEIPPCFRATSLFSPQELAGTCLLGQDGGDARLQPGTEVADRGGDPAGGYCDDTPPVCARQEGCIITPDVVHEAGHLNFSFVPFEDPESGILEYRQGPRPTRSLSLSCIFKKYMGC